MIMRIVLSSLILPFLAMTVLAQSLNVSSGDSRVVAEEGSLTADTNRVLTGNIPLSNQPVGMKIPKFETMHLELGIGGGFYDHSDIERLVSDNFVVPVYFNIYLRLPFAREPISPYLTAGWDIGSNPSFKAMLLFPTQPRLIIGAGLGMRTYSFENSNLIVNIKQSYPLIGVGYILVPQTTYLLCTVPLSSKLSTRFEGERYSVNLSGAEVSLRFSLR